MNTILRWKLENLVKKPYVMLFGIDSLYLTLLVIFDEDFSFFNKII